MWDVKKVKKTAIKAAAKIAAAIGFIITAIYPAYASGITKNEDEGIMHTLGTVGNYMFDISIAAFVVIVAVFLYKYRGKKKGRRKKNS